MSSVALPTQYLRLAAVDWDKYVRLLEDFEGRHLRITYDRGELEIMATSLEHEGYKKLLARFLETLTEEWDIAIRSLGNMTFKREDLLRGLEPDECWYIANELLVRGRVELDLEVDPPPDLVVEVEVSRSALNRMSIYAALRVPEVWRFDGEALHVHVLNKRGRYIERSSSPTFPALPLAGLVSFLAMQGQMDETSLVKSFRNWVRTLPRG